MFIDFGSVTLNSDHIREARTHWAKKRDDRGATVVFADGTSRSFDGEPAYRAAMGLENLMAPVVPAAPGFQLLRFWFYNEEPNVDAVLDPMAREPIVAWRILEYGAEPVGIGAGGPSSNLGAEAILRPDGLVAAFHDDEVQKDINAWAEEVCARWRAWREKQKAAA
jgi:hypothetical protein